MATLSRRHYHVVSALASPLPHLGGTDGGDGQGKTAWPISPSCVWRWGTDLRAELDKRCRPHLKPTNRSWRVDEIYVKVNGQERFLQRAVDSSGQAIDFLLSAKHNTAARCKPATGPISKTRWWSRITAM